jgi:hypothetical protein
MPCASVWGLSPADHADCPSGGSAGSGRGQSARPPGPGTPAPRRAGHRWTSEASCAGQPQPFLATINPLDRSLHARTLRRGQRGLQPVRRVAAVMHADPVLPLADGLRGRAKAFRKDRGRLIAGLDRRPHLRRRRRLAVKTDQHVRTPLRLAGKQSPGLFSAPPALPRNRSCDEKRRTPRVDVIIRDGTVGLNK